MNLIMDNSMLKQSRAIKMLAFMQLARVGFPAILPRPIGSVALGQTIYLRGSRPQRAAAGSQTNMSTMSTQQPLQQLLQRSSSRSSQSGAGGHLVLCHGLST